MIIFFTYIRLDPSIYPEKPKVFMPRPVHAHFSQVPTREELTITANGGKNLQRLVSLIINFGEEKGVVISHEHLAQTAGTTTQILQACLNGDAVPSRQLLYRLMRAYADMLEAIRQHSNMQSLQQSVAWIRNLGLSQDMNIRLKDMALTAHISVHQLKTYLQGEQVAPTGLGPWLELSYHPPLKDADKVEIAENLEYILWGE